MSYHRSVDVWCFFFEISDGSGRNITDFEPWIEMFNWDRKTTSSSSRGKSDSKKSPDYLGFQLGHCCWRLCCFLTLILTSVSLLLIRDAVLLSRIDGRTPGASEDWLVKMWGTHAKHRCHGFKTSFAFFFLFLKKNPNSAKFFHSTLHSEPFEITTLPVLPPFNHDFYSTCAIFWWVSSNFSWEMVAKSSNRITGEVSQGSICWKMFGLDRSCLLAGDAETGMVVPGKKNPYRKVKVELDIVLGVGFKYFVCSSDGLKPPTSCH